MSVQDYIVSGPINFKPNDIISNITEVSILTYSLPQCMKKSFNVRFHALKKQSETAYWLDCFLLVSLNKVPHEMDYSKKSVAHLTAALEPRFQVSLLTCSIT